MPEDVAPTTPPVVGANDPTAERRVYDAIAATLGELPASEWLPWQRRDDIARAATHAALTALHE